MPIRKYRNKVNELLLIDETIDNDEIDFVEKHYIRRNRLRSKYVSAIKTSFKNNDMQIIRTLYCSLIEDYQSKMVDKKLYDRASSVIKLRMRDERSLPT